MTVKDLINELKQIDEDKKVEIHISTFNNTYDLDIDYFYEVSDKVIFTFIIYE